ncbi:MAG: class I SAM-dependent methyltransferase [Acidobacteriota bacterium]
MLSNARSEVAELSQATGYGAEAYRHRVRGYSPEPIRDAAWQLVGSQLRGAVLDAGSGEGGWISRLMTLPDITRITSVDIVDDGASQLAGVEFHLLDLSHDPLPCVADSLDWVFALEVIEHLANPRHFVAEAHKRLREGGKLFLSTPCNDCLTARLSLLFRGYFPAFCESSYHISGHITPVTELDVRRMAQETGFCHTEFYYPLPGRIPRSALHWQKFFPGLQGKLWSDSLFALLVK